jgi:hypothetical protein
MTRPRITIVLPLTIVLLGVGLGSSQAAQSTIPAGTYRGHARCLGSDRFSNGVAARYYRSNPRASVVFGSGGSLKRWTYLFLGRRDLAIQSRAVRRGQSFSYAAGEHIGRAGRTRVTIDQITRTRSRVEMMAHLDWSSPAFSYVGAGTYDLTLERVGPTIRYGAIKVVVKLPLTGVTAANPIVRRQERCEGSLTR